MLSRSLLTLLTFILVVGTPTLVNADAYIRGSSAPWGETTNEAAMDMVFGAGNWDDLRMADGAGPFTPGLHDFIFLEGGDGTANELNAFLIANRAAIENYVDSGGALLLNSAPNQGGDIDYGFGGVLLTYPSFANTVTAADALHPIFSGPFTPVVTEYTGDAFGHAVVGGGITPVIIGAPGDSSEGATVLGEMNSGSGFVMFGGMTTDNFHDPQPEAANLRANIISYTASLGRFESVPVPSLNVWGLITLTSLMMLLGLGFRRKSA